MKPEASPLLRNHGGSLLQAEGKPHVCEQGLSVRKMSAWASDRKRARKAGTRDGTLNGSGKACPAAQAGGSHTKDNDPSGVREALVSRK